MSDSGQRDSAELPPPHDEAAATDPVVDAESGAVRGDVHPKPQPDAWEATKIDLADEPALRARAVAAGDQPATADDEARHGTVAAAPPAVLTGLEQRPIMRSAGGLDAVRVALRHTVHEMGAADGLRMLARLNQVDGIDCQSCAWPDPSPGDRAKLAEYCENGAKVTAEENTRRLIPRELFRDLSVAELSRRSDYWLAKQGRLSEPMVLRDGATHYEPVGWDEAFSLAAGELRRLDSPDEAAFYTSGRTSNEAAFLYQLFARQFGTNNLPDCSNMCHESSGAALTNTIGIGKGTVTLEDVERADLLIDIGHNPGTCHPRMLSSLQRLKRNGGRVIAVNPLPETGLNHFRHPQDLKHPLRALPLLVGDGTAIADLFVPVRIAGDLALMTGIAKALLDAEERAPGTVFDHDFIGRHTHGVDALLADLRTQSWEVITGESAVPRETIERIAAMISARERVIIAWAMGLTQQPQAVAAIEAIVNVVLLRGSIGKAGAGLLPVRGHSNVQGDRTVGVWERMPEPFLQRLGAEFGFEPPRHHGLDTVETLKAMHAGRVKVFVGMGGNFLSAGPDTAYAAEALRRCRLTVHVSTKLNRGHLITGRRALILPTLGRAERDVQASGPQFVTIENSMGIVQQLARTAGAGRAGAAQRAGDRGRLAAATLGERSTVDWASLVADYDRIRERIERVVPGFDDYNRRVREPGGFYLPNLARDRREFTTTTGKANFTVHRIRARHRWRPGELLMMTVRSHDQFNTTMYGLDDRYRGIHSERRVVMHERGRHGRPEAVGGSGGGPHEPLERRTRVARRFVVVAYPIPRRCAATYFPEANVLVPIDSVAERSNTPTSKYVIITVAPAATTDDWDYERADDSQEAGSTAAPPPA